MANYRNTLNFKYNENKDSIIDKYLQNLIKQYENIQQQQLQAESINDQQVLNQIKVNINCNLDFNRSIKPLCMFKDLMSLKKQNTEKKNIIKKLSKVNNQLKTQYKQCLENNEKMQKFLKQIQFTFKNDQSNQKANQILIRAKKTLHRQQQQCKNNYKKISKNPKANYIRYFKHYFQVLHYEKNKLQNLIKQCQEENKMRKYYSDFTNIQQQKYTTSLKKIQQMIYNEQKIKSQIKKNQNKEQIEIGIKIKKKKINTINEDLKKITQQILKQLVKKQGYLYEEEILQKKKKQKNKKQEKDQSTLKNKIRKMKKRIIQLQKQLKQKVKTHNYMWKWTSELKGKIKQRQIEHEVTKKRFELQLNNLSKQYQDESRKYKAQLVQEQINNKKGISNDRLIQKNNTQNIRKIRIVKIQQIMHLKKKIVFNLLNKKQKPQQYLSQNILKHKTQISLNELFQKFKQILPFQLQIQSQIIKLARYIVQDNNNNFTKVDLTTTIQTKLASLIFKHLFKTQLDLNNINQIYQQSKQFLNIYFDDIRLQLWKQCGKVNTFIIDNLIEVLKRRIKEQKKVLQLSQYIEYQIWRNFGQVCILGLNKFQKVCQKILGKKLIKDSKIRISRITIKSLFQKDKDSANKTLEIQ